MVLLPEGVEVEVLIIDTQEPEVLSSHHVPELKLLEVLSAVVLNPDAVVIWFSNLADEFIIHTWRV